MKQHHYDRLQERLAALLEGEQDEIAAMATIVCELYHAFDAFEWVGFYRVVESSLLKVGPYQGQHGCVTIPFDRGVCGKCAREKTTQVVEDVSLAPYHIACSPSTCSEIVVPVFDAEGTVRAVLDIDSDQPAAFDDVDRQNLEVICGRLCGVQWPSQSSTAPAC